MRPCLSLLLAACCATAPAQGTRIVIDDRVLRTDVKRFGINLGGQNFYDSGQMLRNLVARNPGFEGEQWQSLVRCKSLSRSACTLDEETAWPTGFMDGATVEVATGAAAGSRTVVRSSTRNTAGYTVTFTAPVPPSAQDGDFLILRVQKPGNPTAGWWTDLACNGTATAETHDLPPGSVSHQAVRIDALQPCGRAVLLSYFDSLQGHSFVRLNGTLTLHFRAKPLAAKPLAAKPLAAKPLTGKPTLLVHLDRQGGPVFFDKIVPLDPGWHDYTFAIPAADKPGSTGAVGLGFTIAGSALLLDDVSLTAPAQNPTAFRDEVVTALRDLHPGILRAMDSGTGFGTSLDNWLAPPNGRQRSGYSTRTSTQDDIRVGLHEFLQLAETVGAEPWISLPAAFSEEEAKHLIEYLSGATTTRYGGIRATLGHPAPWSFATVHLELGNEVWNRGSFDGATIDNPQKYGERAARIFRALRTAPGFRAARYDLVAGSWSETPQHTAGELKTLAGTEDSIAVAPYLFSHFESAPGMEGVYGPMLAQPEQMDSTGGAAARQAEAAHAAGKRLAIYEVNLGTLSGAASITQTAIDRTVPTTGAAIATATHMLLLLRDLGVTDQCFFALSEFANGFTSPDNAGPPRTTPLYGAVVDMGGLTDRRRPSYLALQLMNRALLPNLLQTTMDGDNPIWNQQQSPNDSIALPRAHLLQSFAFADGKRRSLLVVNLSRTEALPVTFAGNNAPHGAVVETTLTSTTIEDSNETAANVAPRTATAPHFNAAEPHLLPPFSLTSFSWTAP